MPRPRTNDDFLFQIFDLAMTVGEHAVKLIANRPSKNRRLAVSLGVVVVGAGVGAVVVSRWRHLALRAAGGESESKEVPQGSAPGFDDGESPHFVDFSLKLATFELSDLDADARRELAADAASSLRVSIADVAVIGARVGSVSVDDLYRNRTPQKREREEGPRATMGQRGMLRSI